MTMKNVAERVFTEVPKRNVEPVAKAQQSLLGSDGTRCQKHRIEVTDFNQRIQRSVRYLKEIRG